MNDTDCTGILRPNGGSDRDNSASRLLDDVDDTEILFLPLALAPPARRTDATISVARHFLMVLLRSLSAWNV